jgi:hypothetical protein
MDVEVTRQDKPNPKPLYLKALPRDADPPKQPLALCHSPHRSGRLDHLPIHFRLATPRAEGPTRSVLYTGLEKHRGYWAEVVILWFEHGCQGALFQIMDKLLRKCVLRNAKHEECRNCPACRLFSKTALVPDASVFIGTVHALVRRKWKL